MSCTAVAESQLTAAGAADQIRFSAICSWTAAATVFHMKARGSSCMDGVPLKMPQAAASVEVIEGVKVTLPDYLTILRDTEYEFSLENWMLTGLQNSFTKQQQPHTPPLPSELQPSCPPYWMMFSSPQRSRHSSDFWEPNPRLLSHSLNPAVLRAKFSISDSEDKSEHTVPANKVVPVMCSSEDPAARCRHSRRKPQKAFVPDLLNPPPCLSSLPHQRRKNLRQCSLSVTDLSTLQESNTESASSHIVPGTQDNPLNTSISDHSSPLTVSNRLGCKNLSSELSSQGRLSGLDSSAEVLSALSTEERALVGAITAQGYSLRAAIIALQQTPEQMLTYLIACEHLCQLGYDITLVEEALEMFQNCETKAEEFLCLLSQFNEMGFQQNTIKEVLLVHENHRERVLEELMMRVS